MTALLWKDFYTLWKQLRFYCLLILIWSAAPIGFLNVFAVAYAAMLPYSAMAYDERSKWNQLERMMPYSERDTVLEKYVLGWILVGISTVILLTTQGVLSLFRPDIWTDFTPVTALISGAAALCLLAINLPFLYRFGVEKGRLTSIFTIVLVCGGAGALSTVFENTLTFSSAPAFERLILPLSLLLAVLLTAISVPLSIRLYRVQ